ncbi:DUF1326 domain-containing protein [Hahella ganghwensis]|uniref:DUF1326 domain-containing protein n=1 Tax=Hahella ganghwensis TaxID=286420 RepID=UPI0003666850|nr:DUF1326 domain-containing protein [Hahella ganghwensis]
MSSTENKWSLSMHQIECCNCSHGCGCQFDGFPDSETGGCEAILGFSIISGQFNELDLSGLKMVFVAQWPKAIHEGNGKGALFIDSAATPEQVTALATIMSGQAGGMPVEAIAGTFTEFEGPIIKNITMNVDEKRSSFSIEGILTVEQQPLINPITGKEQNVHITFPDGGFMWDDGNIGHSKEMSVDFNNIAFKHEDRFAAKAIANWGN